MFRYCVLSLCWCW